MFVDSVTSSIETLGELQCDLSHVSGHLLFICRYVVDFYNAAPLPGMPIAMHLDVRPALDSPSALFDRLRMQYRWMNSGRWKGQHTSSEHQPHHEQEATS